MCSVTIASVHHYASRFMRSTDLSRDFNDPNGLDGYCLTEFGRACLSRISDGLKPESTHRAWRLTGDFGSGKSSFALLLANTMQDATKRLPKNLRDSVLEELPEARKIRYIPVLVTGNREPITSTIIRSLQQVLYKLYPAGTPSNLELSINNSIINNRGVSNDQVLKIIEDANTQIIRDGKARGMLLILDEVGKFLEFAALNPEEQDIYFLQQLAEMANRSGKQPLMVVCLLHQGFNAYAEQLAESTQREWEKVSGRFDEILFQQPLDQIAMLVSSAINPEEDKIPISLLKETGASLSKAFECGWYGTSTNREILKKLQYRLFPLDPFLLPVLVRTFQRFGQNERSLYSFLCSYEPFGLRVFCNAPLTDQTDFYQLADFYDYIRANFGHRLNIASYRTHWNVIESIIESRNTDDVLELRVLKTIGILNLLGADDLKPTEEAICWAVNGNSKGEFSKVIALLKKLAESRIIYFRGISRGYSLWPYTSVDIETRLEDARRTIPLITKVTNAISEQLISRPIVARAHYIETGNLRYFDVIYCRSDELADQANNYKTIADGFILVPLCETNAESQTAKIAVKNIGPRKDVIRLIAIPRSLHHLNQAALDVLRWEWVQNNTLELNNDRFAREEVQIHLQESRNRLQNQIQAHIGLDRLYGKSSLTWFYFDGNNILREQAFNSGRQMLSFLSALCNKYFDQAPIINNELVNRHNPSPAANAARIRLLELMFTQAEKPDLGLPTDRRPPEKSMYLSILKATGLHRKGSDRWYIAPPSPDNDIAKVCPALSMIKQIIVDQPDTRIPIKTLMETLRRPPYGLRDGLFPILLAVVAVSNEQEIAFYENGTFLQDVGRDVFLRMTKAPERFDIQYCKIEGIRSRLFVQLAQMLALTKVEKKDIELLDIVRSLCQFVARLPEYVRKTKRLSATTLKVRDLILEARDPVLLVFHGLPEVCGFGKFEVGKPIKTEVVSLFVAKLKESLDELRAAFPNVLHRIETGLAYEFGYGNLNVSRYRSKLAKRAENLLVFITEKKLKVFAFRLLDESLSEADWMTSVAAVLSLHLPGKWKDEDEDTFIRELENLAGQFKRTESVVFGSSNNGKATNAIRIAITHASGNERQEVVHIDAQDDKLLKQLQGEIAAVIHKHERLGIAAASRAIWDHLKPVEENNHESEN